MLVDNLKCPVCGSGLRSDGRSVKCQKGHSFDIARQGYVNFMLRGGCHGDDRMMLAARRDFLSAGYYDPVARALCAQIERFINQNGTVLDMGCGEGYYAEAVSTYACGAKVLALDISKYACAMTARRCEKITVFTASSFELPIKDEVCDCAVSVFAPFNAGETRRVLKHGGGFIRAYPLKEHLFELKQAVYDVPQENPDEVLELPGFKLYKTVEVSDRLSIKSAGDIRALFAMTPYVYKTGKDQAARLELLDALDCTLAIGLAVYVKL